MRHTHLPEHSHSVLTLDFNYTAMIRSKLLFPFIFIALCTIGACKKLDQVNYAGVAANKVFVDSTSFKDAVNGLYNTLGAKEYYGAFYPMFADLNSDNGIAGGYNNTSLVEFGSYNVGSSNLFLENMYVSLYNSIGTANAILNGLSTVKGVKAPQGMLKSTTRGTCLAIRALVHFDLLRAFGYHWDLTSTYGIPIVLKVQGLGDIVPRSSVAQTYKAILSDLNEADDSLQNSGSRDANYVNLRMIQALKARVYFYMKDYVNAGLEADSVINDGAYKILDANNFQSVYTSKKSVESIFELAFNQQNQSFFNSYTYARTGAATTEIFFIASQYLDSFFVHRQNDLRVNLLNYTSVNIAPNGRTLKYRGEINRDNPAYILRLPEMYLIRAASAGLAGGGLADLNTIRTNRGMSQLGPMDIATEQAFQQALEDERRAEFNFEGHRFFDLARTGQVSAVLGVPLNNAVWPIPNREIAATKGVVIQNPGY